MSDTKPKRYPPATPATHDEWERRNFVEVMAFIRATTACDNDGGRVVKEDPNSELTISARLRPTRFCIAENGDCDSIDENGVVTKRDGLPHWQGWPHDAQDTPQGHIVFALELWQERSDGTIYIPKDAWELLERAEKGYGLAPPPVDDVGRASNHTNGDGLTPEDLRLLAAIPEWNGDDWVSSQHYVQWAATTLYGGQPVDKVTERLKKQRERGLKPENDDSKGITRQDATWRRKDPGNPKTVYYLRPSGMPKEQPEGEELS